MTRVNPTAQKPSAAVLAQLFEPIRDDLRGVEREFARHVQSQVALIPWTHQKAYIAVTALVVNLVVLIVTNFVLKAIKAPAGTDATAEPDYEYEEIEPEAPRIAPAVL